MQNLKTKLLYFLFVALLSNCLVFAQKYYKIDHQILNETNFKEGLEIIKREYSPRIVTYKTFERVKKNDSLIENISIIVQEEEDNPQVNEVFDFLDRTFPDFKIKDEEGNPITRKQFMGKYSVIALYKDFGQVKTSHIKGLNRLVETGDYKSLIMVAKEDHKAGIIKKADFPVVDKCIGWFIKNISLPESPKFLVLDEKGKVRYIFQKFPDRHDGTSPIDLTHREIFDILN